MTDLTATWALVRAILRRDRFRIVLWTAALAGLVVLTAASVKGLFPTQADLDEAAAQEAGSPASIVFNGPVQGLDTLGGQVAFQLGSFGLVVVGLMSLLMTTRNTRAEEESGRLELVRATVVGRHAPSTAALLVVGLMNVLVGAVVALGLIGYDLPTTGSVVFGASFTVLGLMFAGVALVAAQITENNRVAGGISGAVLGLAFTLRAAGDVGDGTLSWFSPIGLVQKARPYAGERWWPLLLGLALAGGLVVVAGVLAAHRDIGAGLVPSRPGPPEADRRLSGPFGLALRLQRGSLLAWATGVFLLGAAYGSVAKDIEEYVRDNQQLQDWIARTGGASLLDSYYATTLLTLSLIVAGFGLQAALRLRAEETADRLEPVLATPVSRWRWMASHLTMSVAGSMAVLAAGGLGTGLMVALVTDDIGQVPRLLAASLAYAPAVWVLVGIAVTLYGLAPRIALAAWATLAFCFVVGMLGPLLDLPAWLVDVSPFQRIPEVPAADLRLAPLAVLTALAAGLTWAGVAGFRHRDVG